MTPAGTTMPIDREESIRSLECDVRNARASAQMLGEERKPWRVRWRFTSETRMNKRLAAGSGVGLVVGAAIGIILDPMLGANDMALIFGAGLGIVFGAGITAAIGQNSKDAD